MPDGGAKDNASDRDAAKAGGDNAGPHDDRRAKADRPREPRRRPYIQKLAHELKTPIAAIVAASEVMRDEQLGPIGDDRYKRYAADIHDSAKLMLAIIDRMMEQRTRDTGQQRLEFTELDPGELLHATISTMLPLAERAGLRLKLVEPGEQLPRIVADRLTLQQILINLVTNALKFTPRGGEITTTADFRQDGTLAILVKDTGRGMSQEDIEHALEGRMVEGRQRDGGGLGVGLPLVKTLAEGNGASFHITSQPEKGTTAAVIFPNDRVV
ncbi:MAG: hypothetical protein K0U74_13255 [Alphaproteobacteria bacterium]|nr:hypothetical protein [Alphaproteobacteria bacterium]